LDPSFGFGDESQLEEAMELRIEELPHLPARDSRLLDDRAPDAPLGVPETTLRMKGPPGDVTPPCPGA
jgi:hypothetical protein